MSSVEDRLHALSATPVPAPPALDDLRARSRQRQRRRHQVTLAAGIPAVLVALAVLTWSVLTDAGQGSDIATGPTAEGPSSNPCAGVASTAPTGPPNGSGRVDRPMDPMDLACEALQRFGNHEPPAAVRLGRVDSGAFQEWQRQHTGAIGSVTDPALPDTVTVLLVRISSGRLTAPHPRPGVSGELSGDTVYVLFTGDLSPEGASSMGTATWTEITTTPWAQDLEELSSD